MDDLAELKRLLREYRNADDALRKVNEQVYTIRENRKVAEVQITDILAKPSFATFDKLKLEDDNSVIQIQRPTQWNKAWTLSKSNLHTYLEQYFRSTSTPSAEECYTFIETQQRRQLVAQEFSLTRVLPK